MEGGDAYSRFERSNEGSTAFNFLHLDVSFLRIARCGAVATAIGILLLPITSSILIGEYSSTSIYSSKGAGNLARIQLFTQARTHVRVFRIRICEPHHRVLLHKSSTNKIAVPGSALLTIILSYASIIHDEAMTYVHLRNDLFLVYTTFLLQRSPPTLLRSM